MTTRCRVIHLPDESGGTAMGTKHDLPDGKGRGDASGERPANPVTRSGPTIERNADGDLFFRTAMTGESPRTWHVELSGEPILRAAGVEEGQRLPPGMVRTLKEGGHLYTKGGRTPRATHRPAPDGAVERDRDQGEGRHGRVVMVSKEVLASLTIADTTRETGARRLSSHARKTGTPGGRTTARPRRTIAPTHDGTGEANSERSPAPRVHAGWLTIDERPWDLPPEDGEAT